MWQMLLPLLIQAGTSIASRYASGGGPEWGDLPAAQREGVRQSNEAGRRNLFNADMYTKAARSHATSAALNAQKAGFPDFSGLPGLEHLAPIAEQFRGMDIYGPRRDALLMQNLPGSTAFTNPLINQGAAQAAGNQLMQAQGAHAAGQGQFWGGIADLLMQGAAGQGWLDNWYGFDYRKAMANKTGTSGPDSTSGTGSSSSPPPSSSSGGYAPADPASWGLSPGTGQGFSMTGSGSPGFAPPAMPSVGGQSTPQTPADRQGAVEGGSNPALDAVAAAVAELMNMAGLFNQGGNRG